MRRKTLPTRRPSTKPRYALERLEERLVMSSQALDIAPPTQTFNIIPQDYQLVGNYTIPSSLQPNANYTLRQLVGYYDYYYNSTQDWVIDLTNQTYTLSNINANLTGSKWAGRNENQNQVGDLDLFPTSYTGIGRLIFAGPSGSYATITCSPVNLNSGGEVALDRIFHVLSGASLGLQNVVVTGGLALDNSQGESTDALGGGVLVDSGASLTLTNTKVTGNYAVGSAGPNVVGATLSGRQGAGFNAAGGGIYGAAGSTISIDSTSLISANAAQGGHGGNISQSSIGHGGQGGGAYGAGLAINAPSSASTQTTSNVPTVVKIAGGATFSSNLLNQYTSSGKVVNAGGTGGSYVGGTGGTGGNAYGAGLYMNSGQLNLNGGGLYVKVSNNSAAPGPGFSTGTSGANAGSPGVAAGAGAYLSPGQVLVTTPPSSNPILGFSNNLLPNSVNSGLFLPTVTTAADPGYTSPFGAWNLRTAIAAVNPLVATGMGITLNLPASTLSLNSISGVTAPAVANGGFESPTLAAGSFQYEGGTTTGSWTYGGSAAISTNGSGFTGGNPPAPQGSQVAVLQETGSASQSISGFTAGQYYTVSFSAAQRAGDPPSSVQVTLDGVSLGTFTPSGTSYQVEMTSPFSPGSGSHTLTFTGLDPSSVDQSVFIDNVQILPANAGSLLVANTGAGLLTIQGAGASSSVINGSNLGVSAFSFSNASVKLANLSITGVNSATNGGAVSSLTSVVTITNASITHNSSVNNGGGLYQSGGTLALKNVNVASNSSSISGGGLFIDSNSQLSVSGKTTISGNRASSYGGGIYAHYSTVALASITVTGDTAGISGGGVCQTGGSLTLTGGSLVQSNTGASFGGGILVNGGCVFNMIGGKLTGNTTTQSSGGGGGLFASGSAHLTSAGISGNSVSSASGSGGGIYQSGGTLKLTESPVSANTAYQGGGVAVIGGSFKLKQSSVNGNFTLNGGYGAGVFAVNNAAINLVTATVASNISSALGGGIYQSGGTLTIQNSSKIKSNQATQGGGIYVTGASGSIVGSQIKTNIATVAGGGIDANNAAFNLSGASILSNLVGSSTSPAGSGGGIYQSGGGSLSLLGGTLIKANAAASGGGIATTLGTFTDNGAIIQANTATLAGAGFYASQNTRAINFTNARISSNAINATGVANGGGLYISGGTLNTSGFTVKNNKIQAANNQTIEGAGIYATGATINFNGGTAATTTITANSLVGNGSGTAMGAGLAATSGAVNDNSVISVTNNAITQTANGVGGGFAFFTNSSFASSYSLTVTGNTASAGGNDYAFTVTNTADNNNGYSSGPAGINNFTNGTGTLRSAMSYAESFMNGNSNNHSMAIMLSPSTYTVSSSAGGQLLGNVNSGDSLTIVGSNGQATINASNQCRDFLIENSGTVVLQNLKVTGGSNSSQGGGIYLQSGVLTLNAVNLTGNYAGGGGTATNHFANGKNTASNQNLGSNGANGASVAGYGGGIYMSSGTLNLLSNSVISGNTVQGQAGAYGQKGGNGDAHEASLGTCTEHDDAGGGGVGGSGGAALGGGLYQAGGTLNCPNGTSATIANNISEPGAGGAGGAGGNSAADDGCEAASGGTGATGATGASVGNYDHAGGQTAFSANSTVSAQSVSGGLYQATGTLSIASVGTPSVQAEAAGNGRLSGITVQLHSSDGTLIATATTDSQGHYQFPTDFSGMGYIQLPKLLTFRVSDKGTAIGNGTTSAIDSTTLKSDVVQFLAGEPVSANLSFALTPIDATLYVSKNSVGLNGTGDSPVLWTVGVLSKNYTAGFTVTTYDFNHDNTADYILLTRSGKPRVFLVDGRTGHVTSIAGAVSAGLRSGMSVSEADLLGNGVKELVLFPSGLRSGKVSAVDLRSSSVMWTSKTYVTDGMMLAIVGSNNADRPNGNDILLTGIANTTHRKFLFGNNGKLENLENNPPLPPIKTPHPRKIMPKMTRSMKFHR
jgi:fibronectin-binding autotransporter adhesin